MSESGLRNASERSMEIELTVTGRKSGRELSKPVWFVYDDNTLYLLPVRGSDTSWYKNILSNSVVKISLDGQQFNGRSKPIIDSDKVKKL
jgi:hypothetical protein